MYLRARISIIRNQPIIFDVSVHECLNRLKCVTITFGMYTKKNIVRSENNMVYYIHTPTADYNSSYLHNVLLPYKY